MNRILRAGMLLALAVASLTTPALAAPTTRATFHPVRTIVSRTPHSVTTCRVIPARTERLVLRCHTRAIHSAPNNPPETLPACYWPTVRRYSADIEAAAARTHLPAGVIAAVIEVESSGDPNATSYTGAEGLMQIEPYTAAGYGITCNLYDPACNIAGGSSILADLIRQEGSIYLGLAAYNAGPGAVSVGLGYASAVESHVCA